MRTGIADALVQCCMWLVGLVPKKRLVACLGAASERLIADKELSAAAVVRDLPYILRVIRNAADAGMSSETTEEVPDLGVADGLRGSKGSPHVPNAHADSALSREAVESTHNIANGELFLCTALLHEFVHLLGSARAGHIVPCCIGLYFSPGVAATVAASAALLLQNVEAAELTTADDLGISNFDPHDNEEVVTTVGECVRRSARAIMVRRSRYKSHSVVLDAARDEQISLADAAAKRRIAAQQTSSFASSWSSVGGAPSVPSPSLDAFDEHPQSTEGVAGVSHGDVPVPLPGNKPLGRASQDCAAHESVVEQALRLFEVLYGSDIDGPAKGGHAATTLPSSGGALLSGAVLAGRSCSGKTFTTTALAHALSDNALSAAGVEKRRVELVRVFPEAFSVESLLGTERRMTVNGQATRVWQNGILETLFFNDSLQRASTRECW